MEMVVEAVKLAATLHQQQRKKKSIIPDIPYMGHLLEVAGIVQANGGDEMTVAAALLHDAIEDQGAQARQHIREQFGQEVLAIVEACTESEDVPKSAWRQRKESYLKLIETASRQVLLIMVADKLQNGRALVRRLRMEGAAGWGHPGREEKLWYFQRLLEGMRSRLNQLRQETEHPLVISLALLIDEYRDVITALQQVESLVEET